MKIHVRGFFLIVDDRFAGWENLCLSSVQMTQRRCGASCPGKRERSSASWCKPRRFSASYQTSVPGGGGHSLYLPTRSQLLGPFLYLRGYISHDLQYFLSTSFFRLKDIFLCMNVEEVLSLLPDFTPWWKWALALPPNKGSTIRSISVSPWVYFPRSSAFPFHIIF